jgi:hypothetical protein
MRARSLGAVDVALKSPLEAGLRRVCRGCRARGARRLCAEASDRVTTGAFFGFIDASPDCSGQQVFDFIEFHSSIPPQFHGFTGEFCISFENATK